MFNEKYWVSVVDFVTNGRGIEQLLSDYHEGLLSWIEFEQVSDYLNYQHWKDLINTDISCLSVNNGAYPFYALSISDKIDLLLKEIEIYDVKSYIWFLNIFNDSAPQIVHNVSPENSLEIVKKFFEEYEDWYIYFFKI